MNIFTLNSTPIFEPNPPSSELHETKKESRNNTRNSGQPSRLNSILNAALSGALGRLAGNPGKHLFYQSLNKPMLAGESSLKYISRLSEGVVQNLPKGIAGNAGRVALTFNLQDLMQENFDHAGLDSRTSAISSAVIAGGSSAPFFHPSAHSFLRDSLRKSSEKNLSTTEVMTELVKRHGCKGTLRSLPTGMATDAIFSVLYRPLANEINKKMQQHTSLNPTTSTSVSACISTLIGLTVSAPFSQTYFKQVTELQEAMKSNSPLTSKSMLQTYADIPRHAKISYPAKYAISHSVLYAMSLAIYNQITNQKSH